MLIGVFFKGSGRDWRHLLGSAWRTARAEMKAWWGSLLFVRLWRKLKSVIRTEISVMPQLAAIRGSEFFDADWYQENYPDVAHAHMDPARHYLLFGANSGRNPSKNFVSDEYLALHNDVRRSRMNPLVHFEWFGKKEGREISFSEQAASAPLDGTVSAERFYRLFPKKNGRTAIVASYFGKGVMPATLIYLLKGLREVADNVVLVGDCQIFPDELEKLDGLVTYARFERHRQYDFGSYRRALEKARELNLLTASLADELIVINDSNYGPVYPFGQMFDAMSGKEVDFWGMTGYNFFGIRHISSYFYVLRRTVIDSGLVDDFFSTVNGVLPRDQVIVRYELRLTECLTRRGFKYETFVPMGVVKGSPAKFPVTLLKKFKVPLLKAKVINGDSYESVEKALRIVRTVNPELASIIVPRSLVRERDRFDEMKFQELFPQKVAIIAERIRHGGRVKAVFFVTTASMFPARPLFDRMREDPRFEAYIAVVPDTRWLGANPIPPMEQCEEELHERYDDGCFIHVRPDEFDVWPDVLEDVDLACYPSPYDVSCFRYNPHYAVGRNILPIMVNYGFYRSVYDRNIVSRQNYAYLWKAFFECEATRQEYADYSILKGSNAEVVGYVKMDGLAAIVPEYHERKRILIAPHHSVEGGVNKMLSLANFIRYASFFLALPDKHPEIDFVFRPHPFLFQIMARPNIWGPDRVARYQDALKKKPNVIWSDGGDYFREFAECDGCIQDCGSYLVEYMYTGKPCCYMLKSPKDIDEKFVQLGKDCLDNCYVAYSTDDIEKFIRDVIENGNDPKADARREFAKSVMVNYPHAADAALNSIRKALGL